MEVIETPLPGLFVLKPVRHGDARGFFSESWNRQRMDAAGLSYDFVQDNHSMSEKTGTLRGLHYQAPDKAQAKLVRCGRGRFYDAVVDVRKGSPGYGKCFGIELSFENGLQLIVPEGFLHGFVTLESQTEIIYKVTDVYSAAHDGAVHWDSCGIDWPVTGTPILSEKDAAAQTLADFDSPFTWDGS
ncbi:MAG: dTDP-4-dehydrorhamnose 3,5-epimerase [Pseudomonadota bacterium]